MKKSTVAAYVAAALVAGLILGSIGIASAAPSMGASRTAGVGPRLGASVQQAKATLADVVAKLTGTTVAQVREERAAGKSFSAIAAEKNVSAKTVVSETLAVRKAMLDQLVKQGRITQAQADAALARMSTRLTERVSATQACTGGGCGAAGAGACGGMGGGRGAGRGAGGAAFGQGTGCGSCTATTQ